MQRASKVRATAAALAVAFLVSSCAWLGLQPQRIAEVDTPRAKVAVAKLEWGKVLRLVNEYKLDPAHDRNFVQIVRETHVEVDGFITAAEGAIAAAEAQCAAFGDPSEEGEFEEVTTPNSEEECVASVANINFVIEAVVRIRNQLILRGILQGVSQ